MKNLITILIFTLTFIFISCNNTISFSEIINIKTSTDSLDIDYQKLSKMVLKIDKQQIIKNIHAKYPNNNKYFVNKIVFKTVKETENQNTETNNTKTNSKKNVICVEITMNYERSKQDQAKKIIKYSKELIINELIKLNINIEKD
jgi:hypothetical protein